MTDLHLVSENDELSLRNGSAILQIATRLQNAAQQCGRVSWIGGGLGRSTGQFETVEVLRKRWFASQPFAKNVDRVVKFLFGQSITAPRLIGAVDRSVSDVFCHNQPWLFDAVRQKYPAARVHLYVHNRILTGARPKVIRRILRAFDSVICVSGFIARDLKNRAAYDAGEAHPMNIKVVFNGVDAARFNFEERTVPAQPIDIAYVGRIVEEKGTLILARAIAMLAETRKVSFRLIGGATFLPRDKLSPYECQVLGVLERSNADYEFTGPVSPSRIPDLINSAKVLVVPSIWDEPCGLVLLEGLASNAGVVATQVGGMPEVGGDSGAVFVEPGKETKLVQSIAHLLDDDDARANLSSKGKEWASSRNWETVYQEVLEAIS